MALPSVLAQRLVAGEADLALAPVATLALGPSFELVRGICIGADGEVTSVLMVGECPIEDMELLLLDTASRTSVVLAQLIADQLRNGRALGCEPGDHARMAREVAGRTGAVVIGDHALGCAPAIRTCSTWAQAWQDWTGLPFVFAAWIARAGAARRAHCPTCCATRWRTVWRRAARSRTCGPRKRAAAPSSSSTTSLTTSATCWTSATRRVCKSSWRAPPLPKLLAPVSLRFAAP